MGRKLGGAKRLQATQSSIFTHGARSGTESAVVFARILLTPILFPHLSVHNFLNRLSLPALSLTDLTPPLNHINIMSFFNKIHETVTSTFQKVTSQVEDEVHVSHASGNVGPQNRFGSFAPPREGCNDVKWFVDGAGYFWAVSEALERARESIWILDCKLLKLTDRMARVWIISHGTPYVVASFQQTPDKILRIVFKHLHITHPLILDEHVLPCESM